MLDKTKQTGSPLQLVNGLILMSTFAGARLVYGFTIVRTLHPILSKGCVDRMDSSCFPIVIPILPNALRGAGRSYERRIRRIRLRECGPERTERVLVRYTEFVEPELLLRMTKKKQVHDDDRCNAETLRWKGYQDSAHPSAHECRWTGAATSQEAQLIAGNRSCFSYLSIGMDNTRVVVLTFFFVFSLG
jgi:hypothetical protein